MPEVTAPIMVKENIVGGAFDKEIDFVSRIGGPGEIDLGRSDKSCEETRWRGG